jgi:hypothetical protein
LVKWLRNDVVLFTVPPKWRENMDLEKLLAKEKADLISAKIVKGLEENKIVGSANMIAYAIKVAWMAGFEEGRKYPVKESK